MSSSRSWRCATSSPPAPAACLLAALLAAWWALSPAGLAAGDWSGFLVAATPLAIAAMAQTLPISAGTQGLSAGGIMVLVNALVAQAPIDGTGSALVWAGAGIAAGAMVGCLNGVLVVLCGIRSMAATLATGAAATAAAMEVFGHGARPPPPALHELLFGWAPCGMPGVAIAGMLLMACVGQAFLRGGPGRALRDRAARWPSEPRVGRGALCAAYVLAAIGSSLGGTFLAAQVGSVDAMLGAPTLVQILASVALGGGLPGRGGGSVLGSALGAMVVAAGGNLFVPLDLPDYLSPGLDGAWLLAGLALSGMARAGQAPRASPAVRRQAWQSWPVLGLPLIVALTWMRPETSELATLAAGLGLLAAAQANVMARAGILDLSMPGLIAAAALATVALTQGRDGSVLPVLAVLLLAGLVFGLLHGVFAARTGRGAVAVTLATGAVGQSVAATLLVVLPMGFTPPVLTGLATSRWLGLAPLAWIAVALLLAMDLLGRAPRMTMAYVGSALASVLFGVLTAAVGGTVRFSMVDTYLVPCIAAAFLGIAASHRWLGLVFAGAAALVVLFDTALVGLGAGYAVRVAAASAMIVVLARRPA